MPTLKAIASRIDAHLKRFEADKGEGGVNWWVDGKAGGHRPFHWAGAHVAGRYVRVVYVSYQHGSNLTKDEALAYLVWLDAGNVGRHYEWQRQAAADAKASERDAQHRKARR